MIERLREPPAEDPDLQLSKEPVQLPKKELALNIIAENHSLKEIWFETSSETALADIELFWVEFTEDAKVYQHKHHNGKLNLFKIRYQKIEQKLDGEIDRINTSISDEGKQQTFITTASTTLDNNHTNLLADEKSLDNDIQAKEAYIIRKGKENEDLQTDIEEYYDTLIKDENDLLQKEYLNRDFLDQDIAKFRKKIDFFFFKEKKIIGCTTKKINAPKCFRPN